MGVYIKGMEMPTSCGECDYCHPTDKFPCWCYLKEFPIKPSETDLRDGLCPLIEVTEPHGRLIDIRCVEDNKFVAIENSSQRWWNGALDSIIDNAPTVIEAEGE